MHRIKQSGMLYFRGINRHLPGICGISWGIKCDFLRQKSDFGSNVVDDNIDEVHDFLKLPGDNWKPFIQNKSSNISQDGLKTFLQKLAVKPKEARMWLKYFQTNPVDSGLPFAVLLVNEDVFFQKKMIESMAWSLAFLVQNNMNPIVIFEVSRHPRRHIDLLNGDESCSEKMLIFGRYLVSKLAEYGAESDLLIENRNPLAIWKPQTSTSQQYPILTVNTSSIFQSIQGKKIPLLSNITDLSEFQPSDPLDILELLVSKFRPMKTMILSTNKGIVDSNNKVLSDLAIPSDLSLISSADWLPPSQKNLLKRCANIVQMLPSSSSVILTSADTIIQELFTHHGTGTMIKCLEKITKYRSSHKLDKKRFNRLLEQSFRKYVSTDYWESNDDYIDTIFVSEKFSAAGVVMKLPGVDVPYLDKIAVHPEAQGSGLAASLWNEICKDYPKLFWRAKRLNEDAAAWYNTVSQGSWKTEKWTIYWYGLTTCEEVLPLVSIANSRPESFIMEKVSNIPTVKSLGIILQ